VNRRKLLSGAAALSAYAALPKGARGQPSPPRGPSRSDIDLMPRNRGFMRSALPNVTSSATTGNGAVVLTLSSQWGLESDFDLVRLIYASPVATGYTIVATKASPSSAIGNMTSPVNAAGSVDFTMFQQVYFNNAGLDVLPQDQTIYGSGTTSFTVPGDAGSLNQPIKYYSDWLRISSIARTDAGTLPLLMVRTLTDATDTFRQGFTGATQASWDTYDAGRVLNTLNQVADHVTTPDAFTGAASTRQTPIGIQYMTREAGYSVLLVGDSLTQGTGSGTNFHPWGVLSCQALSTPTRPISWWNQGWSGQVSADYWANGYTAFKACKPDIVTIPAWTPNDGLLQANADTGWSRAVDFASYVRKNGATPVFMGPLPWRPITTGAQEAARLSARTRMLNAAAQGGCMALDWEAAVGSGASPNKLAAGMESGTVNHPSDLGYQTMDQQVFRPVLAKLTQR
jgi:hypothetical protein